MKQILVVITIIVVTSSLAVSQTTEKGSDVPVNVAQQDSSVERELSQLSRELAEAAVSRNTSVYDRILADDFIVTYTNGEVATKSQHIAMLGSRTRGPKEVAKEDDVKVRVYGDAAVVTCRSTVTDGKGKRFQVRSTEMWVKRDGRWRVVASQSTFISK